MRKVIVANEYQFIAEGFTSRYAVFTEKRGGYNCAVYRSKAGCDEYVFVAGFVYRDIAIDFVERRLEAEDGM